MTSDEAENMAKQASLKDPNDIYYVAYDDIMDDGSDLRWINGKSYHYSEVGIRNGKPYIKTNEANSNELVYSIEELSDGETINDYKKDIKNYNLKISKLSNNKVKISGRRSDLINYYNEVLGIESNSIGIRK